MNLGQNLQAVRDAFARVESGGSGGYSAIGPRTRSGDRGYGRYQVMGANIGPWTRDILGVEMTPEEFLDNPEAQDRVLDSRIGGSFDKYGTLEDAAAVWFSGRPLSGNNSSDGYNTVPEYVQKVMAGLNGNALTAQSRTQQPDLNALAAHIPAHIPEWRGSLDPRAFMSKRNNLRQT